MITRYSKHFKSQLLHLLSWGLVLSLSSCFKGVSISSHIIPKDAFFASRANVLRATYQVPEWRDLLKDELQIEFARDSTSTPMGFLGSGKAYVFGDIFKKEKNYLAFCVAIRSQKNLERYLRNTTTTPLEIYKYNNYKYILRNRNILAWSKNTLLIINGRQVENDEKLKEQFFRLVNQKSNESLYTTNANFRQSLQNDQDFALWLNINGIKDIDLFKKYIKNLDLSQNYLHFLANFDEGKISVKTEYFTSPSFYKSYQNLLSGKVNKELLQNAPLRNPMVLSAVGINPVGLRQFLKDIEWTEKAENMVKSITLTFDDFVEMIRGDMLLMWKDLKNEPRILTASDSVPPPVKKRESDLVIGMGIKNPVIYDSLISVLHKTGILEDRKDHQFFFGEIYVLRRGNLVYFTKNAQVKDDFLKEVKLANPALVNPSENTWFILHATETASDQTIQGKGLVKQIARKILNQDKIRLESATIHLTNMKAQDQDKDKDIDGETIVLLKDKTANSLLAMLEVLKEVIYQTKLRIDPNYVEKE
ncbi:MAG: DUF4836 family protein [Microscillaceae bacterium]|jgi:hypothetical protein|nr:DUF4836 family protein [Microscillaceae bacterium]